MTPADIPAERPRRPRVRAYAGSFHGLLVVFGALWLAIGAGLALGALAAASPLKDSIILGRRGVNTTAKPIAVLPADIGSAEEIRFRFRDAQGKDVFGSCFTSDARLLLAARTGTPLSIRYDPKQPSRLRVRGARFQGLGLFGVLGVVVAIAGTVLLAIGLAGTLRRRRLFMWGVPVTGVVVSLEPSPGRLLNRSMMKVRYAFEAPSGEVLSTQHDTDWPPEGSDVTVLYDDKDPGRSVIIAPGSFDGT